MSIFADERTRVLVQGITGSEGRFHTERMVRYGTRVVAGVTPGKGGSRLNGIPVYHTVAQALRDHAPLDATVIFVPARFAADAILEAADAAISLIVCITEHIPLHDMLKVYHAVKRRGLTLIGPNCPGLISPGRAKLGILPEQVFLPGPIGIVSRSGTLTYEIADQLSRARLGQSTVVGIGGDPVVGTSFVDAIERFDQDPQTRLIVLVGEIGGAEEEAAAAYIAEHVRKPVIAYIAGFSAPRGVRMGHAGAIISGSGSEGTAEAKAQALEGCGIPVARSPQEIVTLARERLQAVKG